MAPAVLSSTFVQFTGPGIAGVGRPAGVVDTVAMTTGSTDTAIVAQTTLLGMVVAALGVGGTFV